jgi:DNA-3-methyladenine glycosylase II
MTVSLNPAGPFSLAAAIRFQEEFTPAAYDHVADDLLRMAFPGDGTASVIGCTVQQQETADGQPSPVTAEFTVHAGAVAEQAVVAQIARILSLDVDGTGFPALGDTDPVVASLQADYPGLRPVCFYSPYEAAAWTIIGNRIRMTQAAAIKARIAREHGQTLDIAGQPVSAFPTPDVLRSVDSIPGLNQVKIQRLHAIADAALDGQLDAAALRALPADQALAALRQLPGIGPFAAELILIRGAGHPDIFPATEARLHRAMISEYGLDSAAQPSTLAAIADNWRPYRSWVALLLRARAQARATLAVPPQRLPDHAGLLGQGFEPSDAVLVRGGARQHIQVPLAKRPQRLGLLPVPPGRVGRADLLGVAFQRADALGDARIRQRRRLGLPGQQLGGHRPGVLGCR